LRKFKAASNGVETVEGPFKELSSAIDADILRLWTKEAEKANNERGEALNVLYIMYKWTKVGCLSFSNCSC
jgi:hypothetical protein